GTSFEPEIRAGRNLEIATHKYLCTNILFDRTLRLRAANSSVGGGRLRRQVLAQFRRGTIKGKVDVGLRQPVDEDRVVHAVDRLQASKVGGETGKAIHVKISQLLFPHGRLKRGQSFPAHGGVAIEKLLHRRV